MNRRRPMAQRRLLAAAGVLLLSACGSGERGVESLLDPAIDPDNFFAPDRTVLQISGTISGGPPSIEFEPVLRLVSDEQLDVEPGPWTITIDTTYGSIDVPFDVTEEIGGDHPPVDFTLNIQPAPAGITRRISVSLDGEEIGAVDGNDTIPSITIRNQIEGTIPVDELFVEWESDDPEAVAIVYLSLDDGTSWKPVTDWTADSIIRVPPDVLTPTDEAQLELNVSDGVNALGIRTETFTLIAAAD